MKLESLTPNLMVEDVNETVSYYKEVLGFELLMWVPEEGKLNWAYMKKDQAELMFQSTESLNEDVPELQSKEIGATLTFFIKMTGVDDLHARIRDRVTVVVDMKTTFYGMKEFTIKDCNGYLLTFAEEVAK